MEAWQTVLLAFGGNAALLSVLGWLGKSILEKMIAKDTARFEADLKNKSDAAIEELRNVLSMQAAEHQIRYLNLHERRAEAIAEAYALLSDLHMKLTEYVKVLETASDKPMEQRRMDVAESHRLFIDFYKRKKLFIPKEAVTIIDAINSQTVKYFYSFFYGVDLVKTSDPDTNRWVGIFSKVSEDMPKALSELEDNFRLALGEKLTSRSS